MGMLILVYLKLVTPAWLPAVWHSYCIPKCTLFVCLAFKNRLLTKDRMISFGFDVNSTCVLCYSSVETSQHTYVDCPFTYMVLKSCHVSLALSWSDWQVGRFTQARESSLRNHLAWLFLSVVIYNI